MNFGEAAAINKSVPITWRTDRKKQEGIVSPEYFDGIVHPEVAPHRRRRAESGAREPRDCGAS
ncbi:MAG: hypothetical protein LC123_04925, partial [Burkholderiales bacterium]|nr:hypothetical protein [Burkholderiales bacterium]